MGTWQERFRNALESAFDSQSMTLLISDYFRPKSFANIADPGAGNFSYRLHLVMREASQEDWLLDLVAAARERRPRNAAIAGVAEDLGLTMTGPRLNNPITGRTLEALVRQNAQFINPAKFLEGLALIEGQVCWVDISGTGGTGFLVGPDLVLTNDHVIKPILDGRARSQDVRCTFDYRQGSDGTLLDRKKQTVVELHPEWLIFRSPPSQADWNPAVSNAAPNEVDCALIRLAEPIGERPVGGDTGDQTARPRQWIAANENVPAVAAGNQVFLVSHPAGEPLQLSIGTVTKFNEPGTRVRYDANSKKGSSGSPVFNADLKLVALHHATDLATPQMWNQGVPFGCIQKVWHANNIATVNRV